jgi:hypothetical protein
MANGRLIRIRKGAGDLQVIAYIVAIADADEAMELIKKRVAVSGDRVEDVAPVSDALLTSLYLQPGDFRRA